MIGRLDDKTQGDLDDAKPVFIVPDKDTKNRSPRSQSIHSSAEAG
jgi:hypothetical protein